MATHFSTLAWKLSWTEEPGKLQSMGSLSVGHDWATSLSLFTFMHWRRKWQPTPVFLPGESQGRGSLVGCRLWGCTESDTTEVTQQRQQQSSSIELLKNSQKGTSVVVQWLRIYLLMKELWVWSLVREDLPCLRATKPVCLNSWALELQLQKPSIPRACAPKRNHHSEKPSNHNNLKKEMATLSSILAWRIPWTEKPGGLQFKGSQESDKT